MALQFVVGNSGAGKSHFLYQRVLDEAGRHPDRRYLVIVPEQFGMQTQKELVSMSGRGGILNIDVLSFQRLAYRIFEEVGGDARPVLEDTGKTLVLQRVVQEQRKNLKVLGDSLEKPGTVSQMKSLVSELMQYDISPAGVDQLLEVSTRQPVLFHKLKDVQVIYRAFREYLRERYMTTEEILDVVCERVDKSRMLRGSEVVLDGFTGFTPVQCKLLRKLLALASQVTVAVTLNPRMDRKKLHSPQNLFRMSGQLMASLEKMAREERVEILEEIRVEPGKKSRFGQAEALDFLEKNLFRYGKREYAKDQDAIRIFSAQNPRRELEYVARTILKLARTQGYQYRDFAVICGSLADYGPYAREVMEGCGIPYFLDEKHTILMNPFVEYLRSLLNLLTENFSYESVFRCLRCGLTDLTIREIDQLENYCVALGIRGFAQWNQHWVRRYRGLEEGQAEEINRIREKFLAEIRPLAEGMKEKHLTVRDRTRLLAEFIMERNMQEKLLKQQEELTREGRQALAQEYAQIYRLVMELFDKVVQILGDEEISLKDYRQILEAGFQEARVGILPPSLDQVLVGDIERTRLKDIKVLFFVGANDSVIPRRSGGSGLLSEADREFLEGQQVELSPTARESMYIQKFYLYLALTRPSCRLYLSFARSGGQGEALGPAYLIPMICRMYPSLTIMDADRQEELLEAAQQPGQSLGFLIEGLRRAAQGEDSPQWRELFSWFMDSPQWQDLCRKWVDAAFLWKPEDKISRSAARAIYGNVLENSATQLERFAACAFAHFLQYGLQIAPREQYEFRPADMGNVIHQALEQFSMNLKKHRLSWKTLTEEQRESLIDESVEEVAADYGNTILHSSARNEYMIQRMKRILRRTVWALQQQLAAGDYEPSRFEVVFSMENDLEAVNFTLSEEEKIRLKGRIDRMDRCEQEDRIYVKVIDYKSGNTSLDLIALYYGLQLQLVVYMNAAVEIEQRQHPEKTVEPAGIFYYQVKDPLTEGSLADTQEKIQEKLLALLRPNGLVRADGAVIATLDHDLAEGKVKKSAVIPAAVNKDGSLSRTSSAATGEQFRILSDYVNRKIRSIGREILDGNVEINPYQMKKRTACDYCEYRGVCGFDERIPGYHFRNLPLFDGEELWKRMEDVRQ